MKEQIDVRSIDHPFLVEDRWLWV